MQIGRYFIHVEQVKKDHACGECKQTMKKGENRLTLASGQTYPTHLCKKCTGKLITLLRKV